MSQTFTRVGWNGGLGGWAERQCRGFIDFALLSIRRNTRQADIAPYRVTRLFSIFSSTDKNSQLSINFR